MTEVRTPVTDTRAESIPDVAFYGESGEWSTAALLHSEPLIERSSLHAWRIRPHRHTNLTQLFWLSHGGGTARFDADSHILSAPCLAVVPERCVHEFAWSTDSEGFALSFAAALVHELSEQLRAGGHALNAQRIVAAGDDAAYVDMLFRHINDEYLSERAMKEHALDSLVRALTIWIVRHIENAPPPAASRGSMHFERFSELLELHHRAQWSVSRYADSIGVTPAHLNAICREHGGASAQRLIHNRVLLAARRELAYTDKTIADVAMALGFSEPSYFSRFFKRGMRMTPRAFRRRSGTLAG